MVETSQKVKGLDEMFCPSCGQIIKREAVICVHCCVPIKNIYLGKQSQGGKSKQTAIILAIFLGFFAWIYTIQRDWWKFLIPIFTVFFVAILVANPDRFDKEPSQVWGSILLFLTNWLWPVIHSSVRSSEFYEQYPNYK